MDWSKEPEAALRKLVSVLEAAEARPPKGRLAVENRYFTHFGIEEQDTGDERVILLDVVSFDIEETYSVLTQFEFRVKGEKAWLALGLSGPQEIKGHLLRTCAAEFARSPAVIKLTAQETKRARFALSDAAGATLAEAGVRVTTLGEGPRATLVFNCGALIDQVCRAGGFLPPDGRGGAREP